MKEVYLDSDAGVLAGVKSMTTRSPVNKLIVECGTIESATIIEVGRAVDATRSGLSLGSALGEYLVQPQLSRSRRLSMMHVFLTMQLGL